MTLIYAKYPVAWTRNRNWGSCSPQGSTSTEQDRYRYTTRATDYRKCNSNTSFPITQNSWWAPSPPLSDLSWNPPETSFPHPLRVTRHSNLQINLVKYGLTVPGQRGFEDVGLSSSTHPHLGRSSTDTGRRSAYMLIYPADAPLPHSTPEGAA